ncbi:MAG: hypothetical protein JRF33_15855, partial [Deltaproteobacteria bacterium]|nr:hypothetical protein [Deltaproteobacteria bacterium]
MSSWNQGVMVGLLVSVFIVLAPACDRQPVCDVCETPPPAECYNAQTLRTYVVPGECVGDTCEYPHEDETCDLGCVDAACVVEGEGVTIQSLQNPADPNFQPEGSLVQVKGVVVTAPNDLHGFWVSEPEGGPWSGVFVFVGNLSNLPPLALGDVVDLVGTMAEYHGHTQLTVTSVVVTGAGSLPEPVLVTPSQICNSGDENLSCGDGADAEMYEGVYLRMETLEVAKETGFVFQSITGVLDYSHEYYRLAPTRCDDLLDVSGLAVCEEVLCPEEPVSIMQIRDRSRTDAVPEGCPVRIEGVVVTARSEWEVFVQDPTATAWAGLSLFCPAEDLDEVSEGEVLDLEGVYHEFANISEVEVPGGGVVKVGTASLPEPVTVGAEEICFFQADALCVEGEAYESMLVKVEDLVTVLATTSSISGEDYGDFQVASPDVPDAEILVIWDMRHDYACVEGSSFCSEDRRRLGMPFASIVGVLMRFYNKNLLAPRYGSRDFVEGSCLAQDTDCDGVLDTEDLCPELFDYQADEDEDGVGDYCDNCLRQENTEQIDFDGDGLGDVCDNC